MDTDHKTKQKHPTKNQTKKPKAKQTKQANKKPSTTNG